MSEATSSVRMGRLEVEQELDRDSELRFGIGDIATWLELDEVKELRDHLNKVLQILHAEKAENRDG
jgi:hypothetical protein